MLSARCPAVIAGLVSVLAASAAAAQSPFHQGKQLTILINFAPGGPTDAEGRLLARHLGKHVAGNPTTAVKNIGGAGGAVGANWLGEDAPADGLTLGYLAGATSKAVLGDPTLKADLATFQFVAAVPSVGVTFVRTDIGGGLRTPLELLRKKNFWVGGLSPDSDKDVRTRMQLDLLGIKHQYVSGYAGSAEARIAFQNGDIQLYSEPMPSYRSLVEPGPVASGAAIPVWHDPLDDGETFSVSPDASGIPALPFTELLLKITGELPRSELFDAYRLVNLVGTQLQRVLVMPPGTPKEAAAALQAGVVKVGEDPEYKDDALRTLKFVPRFVVGERVEALFRDKLNPEPRLKSFIRTYIEKVRPQAGKKGSN